MLSSCMQTIQQKRKHCFLPFEEWQDPACLLIWRSRNGEGLVQWSWRIIFFFPGSNRLFISKDDFEMDDFENQDF